MSEVELISVIFVIVGPAAGTVQINCINLCLLRHKNEATVKCNNSETKQNKRNNRNIKHSKMKQQ